MNPIRSLTLIAALAAVAGLAHADEGKTREQARAEFAEAQRNGDILAPGDRGLTLRELYPYRYSTHQAAPAKSRAEVLAELQTGRRNGELLFGDTGLTERELHPQNFPSRALAQGKTRAQVRAELAEAIRTGDVLASGDSGLTLREQNPHRYEAATRTASQRDQQPVVMSTPASGKDS